MHVSLYMMDIVVDGSRPILRIDVIARPPTELMNSFNHDELIENQSLGDQPKESFGDHSNEILGYGYSVDGDNQSVDEVDFKHFKEMIGEQEWRSQYIPSLMVLAFTCAKHLLLKMRYNCFWPKR